MSGRLPLCTSSKDARTVGKRRGPQAQLQDEGHLRRGERGAEDFGRTALSWLVREQDKLLGQATYPYSPITRFLTL